MINEMLLIDCNKKTMWDLFYHEFFLKKWYLENICQELNIHKGTVLRWIEKKEIPVHYFNDFNRLLNYKYQLNVSEEKKYKIMDQFFTPKDLAKELIDKTLNFIKKNWNINFDDYTFIEPSAGNGAFYNNLPKKFKKIGLDIDPKAPNILKKDWFQYRFKTNKNIVIGNPPFGLRGQLALKFINKASESSDFICFILPPLFNSNGKGSPMLRVNKNFYLAKEFKIHNNIFSYPSGEKIKVHSIFQIWTKLISDTVKPIVPPKKASEWIKIYSLSNGDTPASQRNVKMIDKCDFYLPSTTFNIVKGIHNFSNLPNNRGYGIVIKKDYKKVINILNNINWEKYSFKSTNGANNLRSQLIINALEGSI